MHIKAMPNKSIAESWLKESFLFDILYLRWKKLLYIIELSYAKC